MENQTIKIKEITYYPKNKKYFEKLLSFSKVLFALSDNLNLKPIVYGSLAYAFYVRDKKIDIHDIDLLVPENSFPKIIKEIKKRKELSYELTNYHSLKVYCDEAKITFDSIKHYYSDLPNEFIEIKINEYPFKIVTIDSLKEIYKRGISTNIIKRKEYQKKLDGLNQIN